MAANDELPRGLILATGPSSLASVTFPAVTGIAWVLTAINALIGESGAPGTTAVSISVNGTWYGAIWLNAANQGDFQWSGQVAFAAGAAVVVQFNAAIAGWTELLVVSAYPI